MRVLVVEDDPMIGRAVTAGLRSSGYAVDWVEDGACADIALGNEPYDVVLLDLGLPRRDGLDLLRAWRGQRRNLPVVVITARDSLAERIAGLDSGADDYLVKPFDLDELLARVRAVVRRHSGHGSPEIVYGSLRFDSVRREVQFRGKSIELSAREYAVFEVLMKNPGAVVSRETLEDTVYGWGQEAGSNSVEVHLHHLRRKLSSDLIRNVRGVGYRIALID